MPLWHPLLAATPTGGPSFVRRPFGVNVLTSPHTLVVTNGTWDSVATSLNVPINGQLININDTTSLNSIVNWISLAFFRSVNLEVTENNYNQDVDFVLVRDGVIFRNLFTIPAGATGEQQYRTVNFVPLENGHTYTYALVAGAAPTGNMIFQVTTDIQYGQGNVENIRGDSKTVVFSNPKVSFGGGASEPLTRFTPMANFQSSIGNEGERKDLQIYRPMFLQRWKLQQTRSTGALETMTVRFLINGVVRFTLLIGDNDFVQRDVPLSVETFPGSGVFVPIKVEVGDTIGYQIDAYSGEPTNPIREFMTNFSAEIL